MKLFDFGDEQPRAWFGQLLEWSRRKISLSDNIEHVLLEGVDLLTTETVIDHPLGRPPKIIIEVARFPYGTRGISETRPATNEKLYLSRQAAGKVALLLL